MLRDRIEDHIKDRNEFAFSNNKKLEDCENLQDDSVKKKSPMTRPPSDPGRGDYEPIHGASSASQLQEEAIFPESGPLRNAKKRQERCRLGHLRLGILVIGELVSRALKIHCNLQRVHCKAIVIYNGPIVIYNGSIVNPLQFTIHLQRACCKSIVKWIYNGLL